MYPKYPTTTESMPTVTPLPQSLGGRLTPQPDPLNRQLGENEPKAWALAWCEGGLRDCGPGAAFVGRGAPLNQTG